MLKLLMKYKMKWTEMKAPKQDFHHQEDGKDGLDELLQYIEEHNEELIRAEKRLNKQLPYWVCKF